MNKTEWEAEIARNKKYDEARAPLIKAYNEAMARKTSKADEVEAERAYYVGMIPINKAYCQKEGV